MQTGTRNEERRRRQIMKRTAFSNARGFSTIQLVITIAAVMIVSGFAVVSISRARDHVRLMNSARQFAAYVERARGDAVRRHTGASVFVIDNNSYGVTMDWDGFGNPTTRNFDLEQGVVFTPGWEGKSVTFDWRGRTFREELFGFFIRKPFAVSETDGYSVGVGVTGSGDVTFESQFFYDSVLPPVALANPSPGGVMPEPGATPQSSPGASPGASPSPSPGQSPAASPSVNPSPGTSPNPSPQVSPGASPAVSPSPGASPNPSPNPSPTVVPCTLTANPSALNIVSNGSANVSVNRNGVTGTGTITATSTNSGQIQVTPPSKSVTGTAAATFKVTVKRTSGSVRFASSGCSSLTVNVTVR